jgi:glycosyltransferase involved in cell wall biosynthesis
VINSANILVSIVIPLYDKASYIRRAIDSVLRQTHHVFELIVVDDGSTDGGGDIVRQISDPRVRVISQMNSGKCVARNRGIQQTTSGLVAFLDADDEWMPDFLETVLSLRHRFPEAAVWGTAYAEMNESGVMKLFQKSDDAEMCKEGCLINFFKFTLQSQQPLNASSIMVRKDALIKAGGFPEGLARLGDTDTLFRMALRYPMAYCPVAKAIYHMEATNRTDCYYYSGNFPFFKHARDFLRETPERRELSEDIRQYLGLYHTGNLYPNMIAGNREAIREIISDCSGIKGYRLKCLIWRVLVWVPRPMIRLYLVVRCRVARLVGRSGRVPSIRNLYATRQC